MKRGRPEKEFSQSGERSKMRKTQEIRETWRSYSEEEQNFVLAKEGPANQCHHRKFSALEALTFLIDANLSVNQYEKLHKLCDLFPPYSQVSVEKKKCYPQNIEVTTTSARVPFVNLLQHTLTRLFDSILNSGDVKSDGTSNCLIIAKWGFDGAASQSIYKHKGATTSTNDLNPEDDEESDVNDDEENEASTEPVKEDSLVAATWFPLQLHLDGKIVWTNSRPASPRFCRPLRLVFAKETKKLSQELAQSIREEMDAAKNVTIMIKNVRVNVHHINELTMVDGKTFSILTNTSSNAVCGICKILPKNMNSLGSIFKEKTLSDSLKHGVSNLHAYIRCLEYVLNVSIRNKLKEPKWRITKELKPEAKRIEEEIKQTLREKMGILVNTVKPGFGSTNDGNTTQVEGFFRTQN
eukprot:Pompholyxophrys_punicea_v1_NODE_351_length_2184_cov_8.490841.p1 type:complete len:410 gc:universal NODE_351_length_2184_cov_8.490841:1595-366(-)